MTTKLHCTFCNVSQDDCELMIVLPESPPPTVGICDDCVRVCAEIVARQRSLAALRAVIGGQKRTEYERFLTVRAGGSR